MLRDRLYWFNISVKASLFLLDVFFYFSTEVMTFKSIINTVVFKAVNTDLKIKTKTKILNIEFLFKNMDFNKILIVSKLKKKKKKSKCPTCFVIFKIYLCSLLYRKNPLGW